jgi:hypothetical protein
MAAMEQGQITEKGASLLLMLLLMQVETDEKKAKKPARATRRQSAAAAATASITTNELGELERQIDIAASFLVLNHMARVVTVQRRNYSCNVVCTFYTFLYCSHLQTLCFIKKFTVCNRSGSTSGRGRRAVCVEKWTPHVTVHTNLRLL